LPDGCEVAYASDGASHLWWFWPQVGVSETVCSVEQRQWLFAFAWKGKVMPRVGGKEYSYTKAGMAAAKKAAKKSGKKMTSAKKK
jgi:hypothetical protein